ncbi:MAG: hypothetical protein AB1Z23_13160, partial [Eubacteriales bacterium]
MGNKHIVSDNGSFILKLNYDFWSKIAEFVESSYEKHSVEIALDGDAYLFKRMDEAYESICEHTDEIKKIKLVAKDNEDILNIVIKNYRDIGDIHTVELYAECSTFEKENGVRMNIMEMMETRKLNCCGIRIASVIFVMIIMNFLSEIFIQNDRVAYPVITSFLIALIFMVVIFWGAVPLLQRAIYGKSKIKFLTNYENIAKYNKMKKAEIIISIFLFIIAVALM